MSDWDAESFMPQPQYIESYEKHPNPRTENEPTQQRVAQFFYNLGFRLGLTIYRLKQEQAQWRTLSPASPRALLDSMAKWEAIYTELAKSEEEWLPSLRQLVLTANPT